MRTLFALASAVLLATSLAAQAPRSAPVVNDVVATQVMLDRAGFSPGEIDGRMGVNVRNAIAAFQMASGLPSSGNVDPTTWERLTMSSGQERPLAEYVVTQEDVDGPFTADIPTDLMEQSRLKALGYRNSLEAIAEKFHANAALLRQLNPQASFSQAGESLTVPNVEVVAKQVPVGAAAPEATQAVTIYVTKATSALTVEDASGKVLFHAPVTSGSVHDPLPIGEWKVTTVQRNPVFNYNPDLFWDANPGHAKATIPRGPNNPVGTIWIDLTKEHYGIHGTPEPSKIGHTESHGCVRLTNWDIQRAAKWARAGTPVIFR